MASLPKLPRRALGSTGISLSVLGFGASPFGGNFGDVTDEQCVEAAHTAFNLGINYFDTSPFYGATKSETRLGLALKGLPRDQVVISTKVGRYGEETFDFSAERVTASVHESLARLQTDYIDLILCHDIEHGDLDTVINETLPALVRLRDQGLVRHIGITGYPLKIFRYVLDRVPPGVVSVVLSYCHHSLNDMTLLELLPYLQEKGVGVINASPLSMGLLTLAGPPPWHPAPQEVRDTCQKAAQHAKSRGVDIAKLALAAALRNADISTTLVGMASADMVVANARSALQALGAVETPQAQAALEEAVAGEVADLLAPVMNQAWPSGRPQNN